MGFPLLGAVLGIPPYPDLSWELGHCAQAGVPAVAQEGRLHGEPPAGGAAQPCPHCPLMARVNSVV